MSKDYKHQPDTHDGHDNMGHWLGLYVLGGLTPEEQAELEALLAERPDLQAQVEELSEAAAYIPYLAEPQEPSPALEQNLMARVEANAQARFGVGEATSFEPLIEESPETQGTATLPAISTPQPATETESWWARFKALWQHPAVSTMAVATAVVLLMWSGLLWQQADRATQEVARLQDDLTAVRENNADLAASNADLAATNETLTSNNRDMMADMAALLDDNNEAQQTIRALQSELNAAQTAQQATNTQLVALQTNYEQLEARLAEQQPLTDLLFAPQTYNVSLPGTEESPEARGELIVNPAQEEALLLVDGLPPLPEGQVYQVLLIYDTGHDTADTFQVDTQGESVILIHSQRPLGNFTAVGISIEPEGGSVQRTGEIMILGELSQS